MKNQVELMKTSIELNSTIKNIKDLYPDLERFSIIKRLIAISAKWDKLFVNATKEGGC